MKTNTKISKQIKKKSNSEIVETILNARKNKAWRKVAEVLSGPRKKMPGLNLSELSKTAKEGETLVVPGKVLSQGELDKKIKVVALAFSESAMGKITESKSEFSTINEEIKKNPEAKNIRIFAGERK